MKLSSSLNNYIRKRQSKKLTKKIKKNKQTKHKQPKNKQPKNKQPKNKQTKKLRKTINNNKIKFKKINKNHINHKFSKQNKQYKIGGSFDDNFMKCYDENLHKIEEAIQTYSGKHAIDQTIAQEFISSQTSPIRRQAAKDLIDNTTYITLKEIDDIIEKLIIKLYTENASDFNDPNKKIYLVTGNIKKSSYFLSVLAMKYIKKYNYNEPFKFIEKLTYDIFEEIGTTNPIIIIDDVSYSGSQLSEQMNSIYANIVLIKSPNSPPPPNIYILLAALNDVSKHVLSYVPREGVLNKNKTAYIRYTDLTKESPFKLLYLNERLYTPLIYKIGLERYLNLLLLFSPFSASNLVPYVSIYLDHKLADSTSTFTTTLLYGQIIPYNVNFNNIYDKDCIILQEKLNRYNTTKIDELIRQFNNDNNTTFTIQNITQIWSYIYNKLIKNEDKKTDHDQDKQYLQYLSFKPFINTCNSNPKLLENIQDPEIIHFDYFLFTIPEGCLESKGKDCALNYSGIMNYIEDIPDDIINKDIRINNKINSVRCPESWYKKGQFEMKCIS